MSDAADFFVDDERERVFLTTHAIQKLRWRMRLATGFDPEAVTIPARFSEITTWKGRLDAGYLASLKGAYARRILELGNADASSPQRP